MSIFSEMVSDTFQAMSSTLFAALEASFLVVLVLGIISTATMPAAMPSPAVTAKVLISMISPPYKASMP